MSSNLLILGAGQYGALVFEIAESLGCYEKIDFLDDLPSEKTVGVFVDVEKLFSNYTQAIVAIGDPILRLNLTHKLLRLGYAVPTLIHPSAYISPSAKLGVGSIVEPFAAVQTGSEVGMACIISTGAVINHNACVGDGCHIDCNATVAARAVVPSNTKITALVFNDK